MDVTPVESEELTAGYSPEELVSDERAEQHRRWLARRVQRLLDQEHHRLCDVNERQCRDADGNQPRPISCEFWQYLRFDGPKTVSSAVKVEVQVEVDDEEQEFPAEPSRYDCNTGHKRGGRPRKRDRGLTGGRGRANVAIANILLPAARPTTHTSNKEKKHRHWRFP